MQRPPAPNSFEAAVAQLASEYADAKQTLWNDAVRALERCGQSALASQVHGMRERGVALARLQRLCARSFWDAESRRACEAAHQRYLGHVAPGRPPRNRDAEAPQTLSDFLGDGASETARSAQRALEALWALHADVSVASRAASGQARHYEFFLLRPGEPEHVTHARNPYIDFDFVPTGHEVMMSPVQIGGAELTAFPERKIIYVALFGRDLQRRSTRQGATAMQRLLCAAVAAVATDLERRGAARDFVVELSAADAGSGKLLAYYGAFGFRALGAGGAHLSVPLATFLARCDAL